ncbi:MAG: YgjV family protein [Bacilli bacterium]|nr:YgjV family protein [Bacilli bacterium]
MFYIQLIGLLGFCILVLSFYKKETIKILTYQITSNFAYTVHYFLLGGLSGAFCSLIGIIRNIVLIKYNNKNVVIPLFISLYLLVTIVFYENIYSIFPMIANSCYLVTLTYKDKKTLLIGAIISSILWILYSIFVNSYISIVTESILIVSNIIQLVRIKKINNI